MAKVVELRFELSADTPALRRTDVAIPRAPPRLLPFLQPGNRGPTAIPEAILPPGRRPPLRPAQSQPPGCPSRDPAAHPLSGRPQLGPLLSSTTVPTVRQERR